MAQYKSRYPKLMFYVDGVAKRFNNGVYNTDNKEEITVLDSLADAQRVDKAETTQPKAVEPKTEAKPKVTPTRKASAK